MSKTTQGIRLTLTNISHTRKEMANDLRRLADKLEQGIIQDHHISPKKYTEGWLKSNYGLISIEISPETIKRRMEACVALYDEVSQVGPSSRVKK